MDNGTVDGDVPVPWSHRLTEKHWMRVDTVLAVLVGAASIAAIYARGAHSPQPDVPRLHGAGWDLVRLVAVLTACIAVPFRRRRPDAVLALCAAASVVEIVVGFRGPVLITVPLAMFTVASRAERRASLTALGVVAGSMAVAALAAVGGPGLGSAVTGSAMTTVGWLAGENVRGRRAYARGLADRAAERERDREDRIRRAAADERMRIARELHDVVAHTMSVIAVRSGVARAVVDTHPEEAGEALAIIEQTSRQALQEMRRLVGVLRQGEDGARGPAELAPAPGLAGLEHLLEQFAQAGVAVSVRQDGEARPLPPGIDLSAYRIIQEALTNVVRHAGVSSALLRISYRPDDVEIEVTNAVAGGAGTTNGEGGHGIVGMRERVALYGGEIHAGPVRDGFRVVARLPAGEERP